MAATKDDDKAQAPDAPRDDSEADAGAADAAERRPDARADEEPGARDPAPRPRHRSRILRTLYWLLWFFSFPLAVTFLVVWALIPPSGVERGGAIGWIEGIVRGQPVPVFIVLFTLLEMALWAARSHLPFARHAHPPLRPDLPSHMRSPFERARALLDEAEMILEKQKTAVVRDLTAKEREKLKVDLDGLRRQMEAKAFDEDAFVDALVKADGEVDIRLGRWRKSEVREYVEAIVMAALVAFGLRAFVVEAFKIPSGSMIPTLQVGDHIFVNKLSYGPQIPWTKSRLWSSMPPQRGDVMVFAFPERPQDDFIKRVIVVEGDKLEVKNGHPWINGWEVPSCFVGEYSYTEIDNTQGQPIGHRGDLFVEFLEDEAYLTFYDKNSASFPETQGPYYAKKGEVWVMGDNRNNSHDSRMWNNNQGAGVPFENIRGRALFVWLSVSDNGFDASRLGAPVMGRPRLPAAMKGLEGALSKCLRERPAIEKTTPPPPPAPPAQP